ncbi:SidA/IucD/PvdA family monooxygenase, partial [Enterobacter hormaechei]
MPSRSVTALTRQENGHRLSIQHHLDGGREQLDSDVVIFATGYRAVQPAFLAPLSHRLHLDTDEAFCINNDFTLEWDGPQSNRLFAVNAGMHRL